MCSFNFISETAIESGLGTHAVIRTLRYKSTRPSLPSWCYHLFRQNFSGWRHVRYTQCTLRSSKNAVSELVYTVVDPKRDFDTNSPRPSQRTWAVCPPVGSYRLHPPSVLSQQSDTRFTVTVSRICDCLTNQDR